MVPILLDAVGRVRVAMPAGTLMLWQLSHAMRQYRPLLVLGLVDLGVVQFGVRRRSLGNTALDLSVAIAGTLLIAGAIVGVMESLLSPLGGLLHLR